MQIIEKPEVVRKLREFYVALKKNKGQIGVQPRIIDLSYDNACNFKCEHCFTKAPDGVNTADHLSLNHVKDLADQAHELGFYEFDLQGGELLIKPDRFFELVEVIDPMRFYIYLTTNGYYLDEKMANRLAAAKINRVSVSIDSIKPEEHDAFRGKQGAHEKAMKALEYVKNVGIEPFMNITVGHYNAFSKELEELLAYSKEHGYSTILNAAVPAGCWKDNTDIMLNDEDREQINKLRKKYGNVYRDLWNPFDREKKQIMGCNAGNLLYITPKGDVLPCPYLHMKLGNIKENRLKEILEFTFKIKYFRENSKLCLAGEDKEFVCQFMNGEMSTFEPADAKELFKNYIEK